MKRSSSLLVLACVLGIAPASRAEGIPVTTCAVTIPAGQQGVLQNDVTCVNRCTLDPDVLCSPGDDEGVCGDGVCRAETLKLEAGAQLDLAGHTITMALHGDGVVCLGPAGNAGRCTVTGPGIFNGAKGAAIASADADLVVANVTIGQCDDAITTRGRLTATGLVTESGRENTIQALGGVRLRHAVIAGDYGIVTDGDVRVTDVDLSAPGGIQAGGRVRGRDLRLSRNADVRGRDVALRGVTVTTEPFVQPPVLVAERTLRLLDSSVAGIESGKRPQLPRTTCDTSTVFGTSSSWGVCSGD
ncbi:hypothetical protein K2Z84_18455 [Candidatus Binatia bacterium]|nr:hypothetical protein [Candidatus Binatia bacterium]